MFRASRAVPSLLLKRILPHKIICSRKQRPRVCTLQFHRRADNGLQAGLNIDSHSQNAHHRNAGHSTLRSPAFQFAYQRNFSVSLCPLTVSKVFNCIVRSKVIHEIIVGIDLSIRRNIDKFYFAIGIDFSLLNLETGFA